MTAATVLFLSGMLTAGFLVVAGFFLRFWRETRDRFFLLWATAFLLFAIQRVLLVDEFALIENQVSAYGLRMIGFVLIVFSVVVKNRERPR